MRIVQYESGGNAAAGWRRDGAVHPTGYADTLALDPRRRARGSRRRPRPSTGPSRWPSSGCWRRSRTRARSSAPESTTQPRRRGARLRLPRRGRLGLHQARERDRRAGRAEIVIPPADDVIQRLPGGTPRQFSEHGFAVDYEVELGVVLGHAGEERPARGRARARLRLHGLQRRRRPLGPVPQRPARPRPRTSTRSARWGRASSPRDELPDWAVDPHRVARQRRAAPGRAGRRAARAAARRHRVALVGDHARAGRLPDAPARRPAAARSSTRRASCSPATSSRCRRAGSASSRTPSSRARRAHARSEGVSARRLAASARVAGGTGPTTAVTRRRHWIGQATASPCRYEETARRSSSDRRRDGRRRGGGEDDRRRRL